jgi:hypothetical protein
MPALEASPTDKHWRAPHASKARLSLVARLERDVDRFETAEDVLKASKTATAKQLQRLPSEIDPYAAWAVQKLPEQHAVCSLLQKASQSSPRPAGQTPFPPPPERA